MSIIVADEKQHITTATTTQVLTGQGKLKNIVINTAPTGTITVVDSASSTTPVIAVIAASTAPQTLEYNCIIKTGIRIITSDVCDITVTWNI